MPRRPSLVTGLALSCLLLACVYAALPRLIAGILESRLVDLGFVHAAVICGYPSWDRLRLDELRLVRRDESGNYSIRVFGVTVSYRLLAGRIDGIRLARVEIERVAAPDDIAPAATPADTGTAVLTPGQWLAGLPMEELSVDALHLSWRDGDALHALSATGQFKDGQASVRGQIHPAGGQALELSARLDEKGEMHLTVGLPGQGSPILNLDNRVIPYTDGAMKIEGALQAQLGPLAALLGACFDWGECPGKLEGSLKSRWQGALPAAAGAGERMRIDSQHHLDLQAARLGKALEQVRARLDMTGLLAGNRLTWRIGSGSVLSARVRNHGPDSYWDAPLEIGVPKGVAGHAELGGGGFTVTLQPGFPIRFSPLQWGGISLAESRIELAEAVTLRHETRSARWSASSLRFAVPGLGLRWSEGEAKAGVILIDLNELEAGADDWKGKGNARIEGIRPVFRGKSFPAVSLTMPFRMDGKRVDAEAHLAIGEGQINLNGKARHDMASGQGQVRFEATPVVFDASGGKLSHLLAPWRSPLELSAGRIAADGRLDWRGLAAGKGLVLDGEIRLHGEGLAGRYETIGFTQLSADLALSGRDGLRTHEPARLRVGHLDIGFPVTDLRVVTDLTLSFGGKPPAGELHELSLGLLGGTARTEAGRWNLAAAVHPVSLTLRNLSLAEIVALENREDLQAKGTLDGRLPLEISKTGVALRGGELHARPPGGVIRYRPRAGVQSMANGNTSMSILLQALRNLNYAVLKVNADSTPDGDLTLKVALQGRNPDWQSGRPIHLNLRLEENIPKLLRSLQLADDINRRVQDHFRIAP